MKNYLLIVLLALSGMCRADIVPPPAASQVEVDAGTVGNKYVSPKTMAASPVADARLSAAAQNVVLNGVTNGFDLYSPRCWWRADHLNLTNGQPVPSWPSVTSSDILTSGASAPTFSTLGANGDAAVYFNGSQWFTNGNFFVNNGGLTNNITVFVVCRPDYEGVAVNSQIVFCGGTPTLASSFVLIPAVSYDAASALVSTFGFMTACLQDYRHNNVYGIRYSRGSRVDFWVNGRPADDSAVTAQTTSLDLGGNLTIGNYRALNSGFTGWVTDVLIYTNFLSDDQFSSVNKQLLQKHNPSKNELIIDGESIQASAAVAKTTNSLAVLVAANLPGWSVNTTARSGHTSFQILTNFASWVKQPMASANRIIATGGGAVNDSYFYPASTTISNITAYCNIAHSNNIAVILIPTLSCAQGESNGVREVVNAWMQTNTIADGYCDFSIFPQVWTNNAYSNTTYFASYPADVVPHPIGAAYQLFAPVVATKALNISLFGKSGTFISSNITLLNSETTYAVPHHMGVTPKKVWAMLYCVTNDAATGYVVGDLLWAPGVSNATGANTTASADNTNVRIGFPTNLVGHESFFLLSIKGTGSAAAPTSYNNFKLIIFAER